MSQCYTKEFKQTILDLYNQSKNVYQLSLVYEVSYSSVLKWVQDPIKISYGKNMSDKKKDLKNLLKEKDEEITL